jgi:hypothetical protein
MAIRHHIVKVLVKVPVEAFVGESLGFAYVAFGGHLVTMAVNAMPASLRDLCTTCHQHAHVVLAYLLSFHQ